MCNKKSTDGRIKLFTHNDLDGIGSVVLATIAYGPDNVDYEQCVYGDIDDKIMSWREMNPGKRYFVTDISMSEETARSVEGDDVYLFDHHPTAMWLKGRFGGNVSETIDLEGVGEIKTCGTELYYRYLVGAGVLSRTEFLDNFVDTVRNYDTWRWTTLGEEGVNSKLLNDLYYIYGHEHFIKWVLDRVESGVFPWFNDTDRVLLTMKQREIDEYIKEKMSSMKKMDLMGRTAGVVFAEKYQSELGNKICEKNKDIDFVAMIDMSSCKVSYRSVRDDIHLGVDIASAFGGGGHAKAAGSQFDAEKELDFIMSIFSR